MKNSKQLFHELINKITLKEDKDEIQTIAYLILEHIFNISKTNILAAKEVTVIENQEKELEEIIERINNSEPLQYVLGYTEFYKRNFKMIPSVLIPRPETEELVNVVKLYVHDSKIIAPSIVDIGTGSGCIAITLALEISSAKVSATDISAAAIAVAKQNALSNAAVINCTEHDILKDDLPFKEIDVIVSNPPYITEKEKREMRKHVLEHEPHLALFVPDNDPLLFYKTIVARSTVALRDGGLLAFEINEQYGKEVASLLKGNGFEDVEIVKDIFNKDRFVKGIKA